MTLRELEYLVALARFRHFGRAAEACCVSQPTLSTQLKKLEGELGMQLVERGTGGVLLTPFGKATAERARKILAEVQHIKDAAQEARDPESGAVRLGIFPTLGPYLLPAIMLRFAERFPSLKLSLIEEKSLDLLARLEGGEIDAALLALPVEGDAIASRFLFEEPFLFAVPAAHPLAGRGRIGVEEIEGEALLLLEDGHCLRDQALDICGLTGAAPQPAFRAASLETLRHMVGAGLGVTLLPQLATTGGTAAPGVRLVRFSTPAPSRRIALVWRRSSARAALFGAMADLFGTVAGALLSADPVPLAPAASRPAA
ncbi:LysR substrate-binding domain-containing protein [Acuticoccus sp. I52.16.1]|uniref:LysR substrate-binding domain-containing protein n=1 Tax=Acuticoccus sp. I52.16.1 TaxID=2928472 RepID=UPI001FD56D9E|nr:LysR substrate-binding domain-containing protein [Acuticoccus sp. I52.16.1]UOM32570.1 LysR substrate-binding domain-containing protein [Acuticoccus sp. I52.16.1]